MANTIWQRIEHKVWEVNEGYGADVLATWSKNGGVTKRVVRAVLARLDAQEREALVTEALSDRIGNAIEEIWDDGCQCEEHLASCREDPQP